VNKYLTTLLIFATFNLIAQEWAPIGATWHYSNYDWDGNINYEKWTVTKDTIFEGVNCRKIVKENIIYCYERPEIEYTFERNDSIFFWDTLFNEFQLFYNFSPTIGDSITYIYNAKFSTPTGKDTVIMYFDSISNTTINTISLKKIHVSYLFEDSIVPGNPLIESIGDLFYFFHFNREARGLCDGDYTRGLRCYEDSNIGFFQVEGQDSCEHNVPYTSIKNDVSDNVVIYPNPVENELKIISEDIIYSNYRVIDNLGQIQFSGELKKSKQSINTSTLQNGIYFIQLENKNLSSILDSIVNASF